MGTIEILNFIYIARLPYIRLLAVPFKIVAKAREIAERKTGANERRERGERRFFSLLQSRRAVRSRFARSRDYLERDC